MRWDLVFPSLSTNRPHSRRYNLNQYRIFSNLTGYPSCSADGKRYHFESSLWTRVQADLALVVAVGREPSACCLSPAVPPTACASTSSLSLSFPSGNNIPPAINPSTTPLKSHLLPSTPNPKLLASSFAESTTKNRVPLGEYWVRRRRRWMVRGRDWRKSSVRV